jgi:hypothetical protein
MTITPESKSTRHVHRTTRAPRPLPVWLQVGVTVLLLAQGVQTAVHWSHAATSQASVPHPPPERIAYYYQPDHLRASGNMSPAFQYANSSFYAHAPSAVSVMPVRAYDATPGRWLDRDPLPAK